MDKKRIEITQKMLEQALLCCAKDGPAPDGINPCADCYLMQKNLIKDGHVSTGETCFMHLAQDAIDFIRKINDFDKSQCKIMLEKMERMKIENAQLRTIVTQTDPKFFTRKCRVCGCDWNHACNDNDYWVDDNLCSVCVAKLRRKKK